MKPIFSPPAHKNLTSASGRVALRFLLAILLMLALCWLWHKLSEMGWHYEWRWNRAWRSLGRWTAQGFEPGPLLEGVWLTMGIAALGLVFSSCIGLALCIARLSAWPLCRFLASLLINALRNLPLLLLLFFAYFLLSPLFSLGPFGAALLALSLFEGAYCAELFRAALVSVPRQQWEAALSLGLTLRQCLFMVIMPQALRNALPTFTNQAVALLKDTSLVSAIAVADLTMKAQAIVAETFLAFEVWLLAAALYLGLALCLSLPGLWLEKRLAWH